MFKTENQKLASVVETDEKYADIKQQVQTLSNLSKTMDTMIGHVIEEINGSRTDMFEILENFAIT